MRRVPPFDQLPGAAFLEAAAGLEIGLFAVGTRLVSAGREPLRHLYVIRRGAVRLERDGKVLQVLEEGEVFGYTSLISRQASLDVTVEDELLAYCLPQREFERLLGDARFAAHFALGLTERLKASLRPPPARFEPDVALDVARLVRREAVWVEADTTVRQVARLMRDEHISSVLLRCSPPGIVTDRDLRNRVVAEDLDPEVPAASVCSRPLRTVPAATPVYEAWRMLLDLGVNHLPVERDAGIVGVVTSTDLLRHSAQGPVAVLRRFERLASRDELSEYAPKLTEMSSALLAAGLEAAVIAGFVAQLNGTLLRRLLHLAEAELGPAPAPYAWLVFGPEGRREQTLPTRQENALVHGEPGAAGSGWFEALAERLNADLEAAGFPPSREGHMARGQHGTLASFAERIARMGDDAPWEAAAFLDARRAAGALDVAPLDAALDRHRARPSFARALTRRALALAPPPGLVLRLRGGSSRVDLERHGIAPIVALARSLSLEARSRARGTFERLDDAREAGLLSDATHAAVGEAFRFLLALRLEVQLGAVAAGRPPGDELALSELAAVERTRLKDAFRAIARWQDAAAVRAGEAS